MNINLFSIALSLFFLPAVLLHADDPSPKPLPNAHAHNDYLHKRPLLDALDQGFCSVEADIFHVDGKLLVAHDPLQVRLGRTLQALYLDPLRARAKANGGRIHRDGPPLTLLIDIKTDGETTYAALAKVLAEYADILSSVEDGKLTERAVSVIISGNRPEANIAASSPRYCSIDGRFSDLASDKSVHLLPLISDNWTKHFTWKGEGKFPTAERAKLREIVEQAHKSGRRVRFWGTPEKVELWKELRAAGVDLINTDDLEGLNKFLSAAK